MKPAHVTGPRPFYDSHIQALHPMPERRQTMYLSTVDNTPNPVIGLSTQPGGRDPCSLRTDDIIILKSRKMAINNFTLKTDDLEQKNVRKIRVSSSSRPSPADISSDPALQPMYQNRFTRRFHTNPLNPEYPGIKEKEPPAEPKPFIKNPLNIADIEGTETNWRAKKKRQKVLDKAENPKEYTSAVTCQVQEVVFRSEPHNGRTSEELELRKFSKRQALQSRKGHFDNLDVGDISHIKAVQLSKRCVDPLNPQYFYYDIHKQPAFLDPIKKARSVLSRIGNRKSDLSLFAGDIEGAQPVNSQCLLKNGQPRKDFSRTNNVSDIENVHPGSAKKLIKTTRCTNPLERDYPEWAAYENGFLIGSELKDQQLQKKLSKKGKRVIDGEAFLKATKNWDIINHATKDPIIGENFRCKGKKTNHKWIKLSNDLFLLDKEYVDKVKTTSKLLQNKTNLRNPLLGEGVEKNPISPVIITDEQRLTLLERFRLKTKVQKGSTAKESHCEGVLTQGKISGKPRQYSARTVWRPNDPKFAVSFRPVYTQHEKFDSFIYQ